METKANYVAVGFFTLVLVLAAFGFVYWTSGVGERTDTAEVRFRIEGSASGLARGSLVLFNGVKVGTVTRVYINPANPKIAIAEAQVGFNTPVTKATRASVGIAGLTGTANIELQGGDAGEESIFKQAEESGQIPVIETSPSTVTDLIETARGFMARGEGVLTGLEEFVNDAKGPLTETLRNVEVFSKALADNSDNIDEFLASAGDLAKTLDGVSDQFESTLASAEKLLDAVDGDQVAEIVTNIETFTARLDSSTQNLGEITTNIDETVKSFGALGDKAGNTLSQVDEAVGSFKKLGDDAGTTLSRVDELVAAVQPEDIRQTVDDFRKASSDVAGLTDRISERGDDIDNIITQADQLATRLNEASVRIDGVLAKVDGLLGSGDTQDLITEAKETIVAFRGVAQTLNARIGGITEGLSRFTNSGLREFEALISDGRRSIDRIERAISEFERNPQRIITGGAGTVRSYDGRNRR